MRRRWAGAHRKDAVSLWSFERCGKSNADTYYVPALKQPCCVLRAPEASAEQVNEDRSICSRGLGGIVFPGRGAFFPSPQSLKRPRTEPQQPRVNHIQGKQLRYSDRLHSQQSRASGQLVERLVNRETRGFRAPNPLSRALDNRGQECGCLASPRTLTWPQVYSPPPKF